MLESRPRLLLQRHENAQGERAGNKEDTMTPEISSTTTPESRPLDQMQRPLEFDSEWEPDSRWDCVPRD
jgi:hypothetical protein